MIGSHDFSREDIEDLLEALAQRLTSDGCAASIYVVGGAAIALRGISDERRTGDIDANMLSEDRVLHTQTRKSAGLGRISQHARMCHNPHTVP